MRQSAAVAVDIPRRVDVPGSDGGLDLKTMGGRIAWARLRANLTQADVAKSLGNSRVTIVQYEKNNITPPIPVVERLATRLAVSPEFLAFGRQGLDALSNAAEEIVTITEMSEGKRGAFFESGAFAMPRRLFEGKDIDPANARMMVLEHDEPEFDLKKGDRVVIDQSVKALSDHDLYLIRADQGAVVVRREPNVVGTTKGRVILTTGRGNRQTVAAKDVKVLGAIVGQFALA